MLLGFDFLYSWCWTYASFYLWEDRDKVLNSEFTCYLADETDRVIICLVEVHHSKHFFKVKNFACFFCLLSLGYGCLISSNWALGMQNFSLVYLKFCGALDACHNYQSFLVLILSIRCFFGALFAAIVWFFVLSFVQDDAIIEHHFKSWQTVACEFVYILRNHLFI